MESLFNLYLTLVVISFIIIGSIYTNSPKELSNLFNVKHKFTFAQTLLMCGMMSFLWIVMLVLYIILYFVNHIKKNKKNYFNKHKFVFNL